MDWLVLLIINVLVSFTYNKLIGQYYLVGIFNLIFQLESYNINYCTFRLIIKHIKVLVK